MWVTHLRRLMEHACINGSGEQIIGSRNSVYVTREMQIELLHWYHLRVTTAGRATLDAKRWSLRRLSYARKCVQM